MICRGAWTAFLLSRQLAGNENQFAKRFRNVEIWFRSPRGLPCGIESRFSSAFNPVEIHFPRGRRIKPLDQAFHGQRQLRNPGFCTFVQNYAASQATFQIVFLARRDVEIDPQPIRTDLEFLIPPCLRRLGLKENLRNVAVPELVTAAIGLASRENRHDAIARTKSQKQRLWGPE